jgi:DNA-binding IclR family transcriptional regulator
VLDGDDALSVAQVEGRHIVGVGSWTGRRTALHTTANGKALLAFSGRALPQGPLERATSRTIISRAALRRELGRVRAQGYATAAGELEDGLNAVAVPVLAADGALRGAISVSAPAYRLDATAFAAVAERCRAAAAHIESRLGRPLRAA